MLEETTFPASRTPFILEVGGDSPKHQQQKGPEKEKNIGVPFEELGLIHPLRIEQLGSGDLLVSQGIHRRCSFSIRRKRRVTH